MFVYLFRSLEYSWKVLLSEHMYFLKCLDNKWAVRLLSDSLKIVILTPEVEWLCTTQLGFTSNKLTQPLKSHFVTSYLLFNALTNPITAARIWKWDKLPLPSTLEKLCRKCWNFGLAILSVTISDFEHFFFDAVMVLKFHD